MSGALPDSLRRAIQRQHPQEAWRLNGKPPAGAVALSRMARIADPLARRDLREQRHALMIHLPGLRLKTWNAMLGSGKKRGQTIAKRQSQAAVAALATDRLHRVPGAVDLHIIQAVEPTREGKSWDVPNLCTKYLIDALVSIGVIEGDHHGILRSVRQEWAHADREGVRVTIIPSRGRVPLIRLNP